MIKQYIGFYVEYLLYLSDFYDTWVFRFSKNIQISTFTKIRPVGAELFHAGGQTDRHDKANSSFSQFCQRA